MKVKRVLEFYNNKIEKYYDLLMVTILTLIWVASAFLIVAGIVWLIKYIIK